ncbi:MAG: sulfur-carrier protein adenylyltransferase/sulfurtransferase [Verrucomicrobiota bacterium]|jgi:adenylyltransferase/sulfurtransferase|nr:sulfur-carrier protein adenylyltransferase/sulfurtransferase [Verrucomicrobiota bacterium]MEA3162873.1 sulfur-carrier protein adenylyltransferase/sulfurtransferase [Verrucomicrobiota bacterium]
MPNSIISEHRVQNIDFSNDEIARYSRHLIMPEVTLDGQKRIKAASVLCLGAGGLGSPIALYLAAAGIGRMGLIDYDIVDFSNLQRQILHGTDDVGRKKLNSAKDRIKAVNPNVQVDLHDTMFRSDNAMQLVQDYDIVIDGTDNFPTRYLSNDVCVLLKKPNIYGSIFRFDGQCTVFAPHLGGPCYRCMFPEPPPPGMVPSCAEGGVLGVLPGMIGVMQAIEAIKMIIGIGDSLIGRLVSFDALQMRFKEFKIRKDPNCPICGEHPTIHELIDYDQFCGIPQADAETAKEMDVPTITATELKTRIDRQDKFVLIDVREPFEYEISRIPGSKLIPLGELPARLSELDSADDIVLHCKMGGRSAKALRILQEAGFRKLNNLQGGITAWSDDVDPSVPKY